MYVENVASNVSAVRGYARRLFGYERVYLLFLKVAETPCHINGDDISMQLLALDSTGLCYDI